MFNEKKVKIEIIKYKYTVEGKMVMVNMNSPKVFVFDNYATKCIIKKVPSTCGYTASVDIFGVSKQSLDQITTIAWINGFIDPMRMRISVNEGNGYVTVFEGGIQEAVPNYKAAPDVSIHIESSMLVYPNLMKPSSISLVEGASIFEFCKSLCGLYDLKAFPDEDLKGEVWHGQTRVFDQKSFGARVKAFCKTCGLIFTFRIEGVYFRSKAKKTGLKTWKFTPETYVGYPTFESMGIAIELDSVTRSIDCGHVFQTSGSVVKYANGKWNVNVIEYQLESRKPGGVWKMVLHGTRFV